MKIHKMKLNIIPFEKIVNGDKIIESRLYDEKRQKIELSDQIEFICEDEPTRKILTKVKALYRYPDFISMFSDFKPTYFGGISKEKLIEEIEKFYSKEKQAKYSVVGIKIELIK